MGQKKTEKKLRKEFSSGGVVFRRKNNRILWLVARSSPNKKFPGEFWRLPKGWLDDDRDRVYPGGVARGERKATEAEIRENALKEVREEGGVKAKILQKIGTVRYFTASVQGPVLKFVTFYLMEWVSDLPEGFGFETAEVLWLPLGEAAAKLSRAREKEILTKAQEILDRGIQGNLV